METFRAFFHIIFPSGGMKRKISQIEENDSQVVFSPTGTLLSFDLIALIVTFLRCKEAIIMATLCQSTLES